MHEKLIVALDLSDPEQAVELAGDLRGEVGLFKVGLQLFTACGPSIVERIRKAGGEIFLDLKLHDIPNTVRHAVLEAGRLGVSMLTLHTSGGAAMLREAVAAAGSLQAGGARTRLLGVTVLTSLARPDLAAIGIGQSVEECVVGRARLAADCGLDGVVASPREIFAIREAAVGELLIVTPGIRPAGQSSDDQARTATPAGAIAAGADFLVVGRPITNATDPVAAARSICREMERAKISSQ